MSGLAFNDTSGGQGLIQDCEDRLSLGATAISGNTALLKTFTRFINQRYHQVVTMILESQDEWDFDDLNNTDYPVATTPGTTNRDYTFPASLKILKIKRVDITPDGSTWYQATPIDSKQIEAAIGNDSTLDGNFDITQPQYDVKTNSLWLYPRFTSAQVSAGASVRVEFYRDINEFTTASTSTTPGFDTPFHQMLSIGACIDYSIIRTLDAQVGLTNEWDKLEARLRRYYGKKQQDRDWQLNSVYGSNYGR